MYVPTNFCTEMIKKEFFLKTASNVFLLTKSFYPEPKLEIQLLLGSRNLRFQSIFKKHVWQGFSSFLHKFHQNAKILVQLAFKMSILQIISSFINKFQMAQLYLEHFWSSSTPKKIWISS